MEFKFIIKIMKKEYIVIIVVVLLVVFFLLYPRITHKNGNYDLKNSAITTTTSVEVGDTIFNVNVVDTDTERTQGLSGRESLAEDEGMLFVFEKSDIYPFWMKDMRFPIDIMWIDENLKVVYIKENATPQSFPEIFTPNIFALYVLEVNSGMVVEEKIKINDEVILNISNVQ